MGYASNQQKYGFVELPRQWLPDGICILSLQSTHRYHDDGTHYAGPGFSVKHLGRASRDALRAQSGWASPVMHGPENEPDQLLHHRTAGPSDQWKLPTDPLA